MDSIRREILEMLRPRRITTWGFAWAREMAVSASIEPMLGPAMRTVLLSRLEEKVSATSLPVVFRLKTGWRIQPDLDNLKRATVDFNSVEGSSERSVGVVLGCRFDMWFIKQKCTQSTEVIVLIPFRQKMLSPQSTWLFADRTIPRKVTVT